jgi:hypothetical protein
MGDMADYALEQIEAMELLRSRYRIGELPAAEAYDESIIDESGFEHSPMNSASKVTCRYCGKHLHWKLHTIGWRTTEADESIHRCPAFNR